MQPPQNPYNQPPLPNPAGGPSFQPAPANVSSTTTLIITGILGIICCGILALYTLIKSNQAIQSIQSGYGNVADLSTYNITRILGIIGTVLWALSLVIRVVGFGLGASGGGRPVSSGNPPVTVPSNP